MIQERYLDLMNGEIDGKNSPSESAELREHLESNAEARTYYAELRNVVEAFGEAGEVRVPEDLEQRIIFAINERRARDEAQRERASLLNIFSPRRKLGIAFAAGVVVGLIILLTIYRALPDSSTLRVKDLYGTLTERERTRTVATSDPVRFDHPEVTGTAIASYFDSDLVVSL
jgi:anti-sigma factor RsiW